MMGINLQYGNLQKGQTPANWGTIKVDDNLVQVLGGFSCARTRTVSAGVPHLRPMNVATNGEVVLTADTQYIRPDFRNDLEDYHLQTGDILFNNTNSVELVGKTAIVREPMAVAFSNHINRLRVKDPDRIDPRWLALALRSLQEQGFFAAHCNKWIGQAGFSVTALAAVDIPLPYPDDPARSLETQHRIVARIEALFAELREARRLHAAIVADTGRLLAAALEHVMAQVEEASYERLPLCDLGQAFNGRATGCGDSEIRVFKTKHVYPFDLRMHHPCYLPAEQAASYPLERLLRDDDVLLCNIARGTLGRPTHIARAEPNWTVDTSVMVLRTNERCMGKWLFYYLLSSRGQADIVAREKGIAFADKRGQTHLYPREMMSYLVSLPPLNVQQRFVEYVDSVQIAVADMIPENRITGAEISNLEQSILVQAFRGEL